MYEVPVATVRYTRPDRPAFRAAVPFGGLGTGSVLLCPDGSLREWQIFNNWGNAEVLEIWKHYPSYDLENAALLFSVETAGKPPETCVLETSPLHGLPGVESLDYVGEFPFASLAYRGLPVELALEAFSSFYPHHAEDSGHPAFGMIFTVRNTLPQPCTVRIALSVENPFSGTCEIEAEPHRLVFHLAGREGIGYRRSGLAVVAMAERVSAIIPRVDASPEEKAREVYEGTHGRTEDHSRHPSEVPLPDATPARVAAALAEVKLLPGVEANLRFVLAWYFPEHFENKVGVLLGHRYEKLYDSAADAARFFAENLDRLRDQTRKWHDTIYSGNMPHWLLDFIANSLYALVKSSWWTKDGRFNLYESFQCPNVDPIHVRDASSAALCALFPELELEVLRRFARHQTSNGKIPEEFNGLGWAPSATYPGGRDLHDNNTKFALQVYRNGLWTGNREFLTDLYPSVQRALRYAASRDTDGDGLPDRVFSSATTWDLMDNGHLPAFTSGLFLAALKAGEEMAKSMGDEEFAEECRGRFATAQRSMEDRLWNGEYYALYCDEDSRRLEACFVDQLYGQFHAHLLNLGHLLPVEHVQTAVDAILKNNASDTRFGVTDSMLPRGGRHVTPDTRGGQALWSAATITFAALAAFEGRTAEALELLKRVYDNHTVNIRGGLWDMPDVVDADTGQPHVDHFGCYLRNGAVWNLLPILTGFNYNAVSRALHISPRVSEIIVEAPFVTPQAWGTFRVKRDNTEAELHLRITDGALELKSFAVGGVQFRATSATLMHGVAEPRPFSPEQDGDTVRLILEPALRLTVGQSLRVALVGCQP